MRVRARMRVTVSEARRATRARRVPLLLAHGPPKFWKAPLLQPLLAAPQCLNDRNPSNSTMSACVACQKPLEVELELDSDSEDVQMSSSSGKAPAAAPETVPDDVHLNCGCHFHWYLQPPLPSLVARD